MIAIDTNVLVRVVVDDPYAPEQCQQARELLLTQGSDLDHADRFDRNGLGPRKRLWTRQGRNTECHRTYPREPCVRT